MEIEVLPVPERLRRAKQQILDEWEKRARAELPHAPGTSSLKLRDELPIFLDELANAIARGNKDACESSDVCFAHGIDRAELPEYEFSEIHREYDILRHITLQVLEAGGPVSIEDRDIILDSIFMAVRDSGDAFSKAQLKREQQAAEALRRERDMREQFVATLTHDMRNPLSVAKASAYILMRQGDDAEMRHWALSRLNTALNQTTGMIQDLLDTNQLRQGKHLNLEITEFELCGFLKDILVEATMLHGDRFKSECADSIVGHWSRIHLKRALMNLLDNAIKYGYRQTPVTLRAGTSESEVVIELINQGKQIPPEELNHFFEAYYRTPSANAADQHGWGLGLAVVKGIVDAHGGRIEAQSSESERTVFKIILPRDSRQFHSGAMRDAT